MTKRILFFAAVALTLFACSGSDSHEEPTPPSSSSDGHEEIIPPSSSFLADELTFDAIQYWVGEGENRAMLIVQWNDGKNPDALAYGYKWSGTKYGYDMIDDIAKTDKRLFYLRFSDPAFGYAMGGIGFNASGGDNVKLGNGGSCESPVGGSIDTDAYDFDYWKLCDDSNARWQAGWYEAYWSYWVSDSIDCKWEYSSLGASSRVLENNSVDAWYFDLNLNDPELSTFSRCMEDPDNCDGKNFFGTITPVTEAEPRCDTSPHQAYNPNLYECKPAINPNAIYLKQKPRDAEGNEYEAVLIGTQVWMAENLNLSKDKNGNSIGRCFEDNPANCEKFGRMYILTEHGTDPDLGGGDLDGGEFGCPDGWRLPSGEDLTKLLKHIDPSHREGSEMTGRGDNSAGPKLKAKSGWPPDYKGDNGNGTDNYGFNALPGGYCGTGCGIYEKTGEPTWSMLYPPVAGSAATPSTQANTSSFWWTTSKGKPVPLAITWRISSGVAVDDAFQSYNNSRFYARCLKDAEKP